MNNVTEAASANVDHDAVQEDGIVPSVPRLGWPGRMVGEHHRVDDVAVGDVHGPHDVAALSRSIESLVSPTSTFDFSLDWMQFNGVTRDGGAAHAAMMTRR